MFQKIKFIIKGTKSENDKYTIESEIDVLGGVRNIDINWHTGEAEVEFDDSLIKKTEIFNKVEKLGFNTNKKSVSSMANIKERVYFVEGMHCASCEIILEKNILELDGVKAVEASTNSNKVVIAYEKEYPTVEKLNSIFKKQGYSFSEQKVNTKEGLSFIKKNKDGNIVVNKKQLKSFSITAGISLIIIIVFVLLHESGLSALISVNTKSSLLLFLLFGVLAGLSSCAALVGGIVLSMSKQWLDVHKENESTFRKLQPHFLFNIGRLSSYLVLGAILGEIGSALQLSLTVMAALIIIVSILMIFLALQMLGIKYFQKFQITSPRFITRYIADEKNFKGKYMPIIMGALTFFLPCGFTITAQGLALASGSIVQGGLIMLFFALGTLPILLGIGVSSVKFSQKKDTANRFLRIAGILVFFFALFNINAQFNVLGWPSLSDISLASANSQQGNGLPEIINGKQILKMDALAYKYSPNKLKVMVGIPVRWEITDKGSSGCTNAVMSRGLFDGEIKLERGKTSIKEFTPEKIGKYKFSCWMGMISGVIEVVDKDYEDSSDSSFNNYDEDDIIPSGAVGCGCGGGGSGTCGG